jgi:hypothetical protein
VDTVAVNLSIVQRPGDAHALGFLDQARYLRYHLGRLGIASTSCWEPTTASSASWRIFSRV